MRLSALSEKSVWWLGDAGQKALQSQASEAVGGIERKSTRVWAEEGGYDPVKLFNKVNLYFWRCEILSPHRDRNFNADI